MVNPLGKHRPFTLQHLKLLTGELVIILLVFFASVYFLIFLIRMVFIHQAPGLDDAVFNFVAQFQSPGLTRFMQAFTFFGSHEFLIPANLFIIGIAYYVAKNKWFSIKMLAVALSSLVIIFALKLLFSRSRPLMPLLGPASGYSFPSGHAFMSFTFFGMVIYLVHKNVHQLWLRILLMIILFSITFLIGLSRIYLRVHYATDVLAGFCLGVMWLVLSLWILHRLERSKTRLPDHPE